MTDQSPNSAINDAGKDHAAGYLAHPAFSVVSYLVSIIDRGNIGMAATDE